MKWAYTGIVRPFLSYAALALGHAAEADDTEEILCRVNHMAINTIVKVPRSTPTKALEIILDIYPLHLHIMNEGLTTYICMKPELNLRWSGVYTNLTHSISHLCYWEWIADDTGVTNFRTEMEDCYVMLPHLRFVLDTSSFVDMSICQDKLDCNVYTNGSKINNQVSAGVYIERRGVITHEGQNPGRVHGVPSRTDCDQRSSTDPS